MSSLPPNAQGVRTPFGNDFHGRGPHVGGHKAKAGTLIGTKPIEEPLKGSDGVLLADSQKPFAMPVDPIDDRDVRVALPKSDLVGPDILNP